MTTRSPPLVVYRGFIDKGKYTWSPYVTKLEFRFRHAGLRYVTEPGSPRSAPKGKIPYIDLAPLLQQQDAAANPTPQLLGDSSLIFDRLESMDCIPNLNENLTDEQKLNDSAIRALCEDKLYFYNMREKWLDGKNFYVQRDKALWALPYPMRVVIGYMIHRGITQTLHGQGTGRFSDEEVKKFRADVWQSIDNVLKQRLKPSSSRSTKTEPAWVLGGEQPTEADATLFGFIVSALLSESNPETRSLVKSLSGVMDYAGRIHRRFFPDYEVWE
ncbi:uncharacterized protein PV06_04053 [Exophiala oligosperma]|uniref:Thioredoxin-like fold domain-containing protein n=2 Tax=Chaetothyriales TaxID=34395 RepID=A0A0D2C7A3_9EURO|nr:uncharacterized protein PV06_04053 [Exophiala oligosperma]KAJ9637462.1 hypothetical protein H2204_004886 [Knufia peltigerae]KIW45682.1 hypothetical protein PV06_04053 [Exophiala oligosperma]